jgi:hypothetical protein
MLFGGGGVGVVTSLQQINGVAPLNPQRLKSVGFFCLDLISSIAHVHFLIKKRILLKFLFYFNKNLLSFTTYTTSTVDIIARRAN